MISVIIAGGKGERFWPMSTPENPKQFLTIWSGKSMLEETIERLSSISGKDRWIITTENLKERTSQCHVEHIICEPYGRNTAMAVALAVFYIGRNRSDEIMGIFPADHVIRETDIFQKRLEEAIETAKKDYIVVFGIEPTRPETGYGYIEAGKNIKDGCFDVEMFREKPDRITAESFLKSGNFFWNSGMFVFKVSRMREAFRKYAVELHESISYLEDYAGTDNLEFLKKAYEKAKSLPVDIAIMERAKRIACVKGDFFWDDVGSWMALRRLMNKDENSNIVLGDCKVEGVKNSIIVSDRDKVIAMGLENIILIQSRDGTLITSFDKIGNLKEVMNKEK